MWWIGLQKFGKSSVSQWCWMLTLGQFVGSEKRWKKNITWNGCKWTSSSHPSESAALDSVLKTSNFCRSKNSGPAIITSHQVFEWFSWAIYPIVYIVYIVYISIVSSFDLHRIPIAIRSPVQTVFRRSFAALHHWKPRGKDCQLQQRGIRPGEVGWYRGSTGKLWKRHESITNIKSYKSMINPSQISV